MTWKEEKERLGRLSTDERRKEYFCGDEFVKLDEINTWKTDALYKSKLANPKTVQDPEMVKKLEEKLLTKEMKLDLDLSEKVSIFVGDITKLEIDGIVNAANNSLLGGGGVDGAIHRAAGDYLLAENRTLDGCPDGEAKLSCGYELPAKFVVSTVGPRGEHSEILENCYTNCLKLLLENKLRSIAFPCISTGIYGYPNKNAANIALKTTRTFLEKHHQDVDRVIFCLFLQKDVDIYQKRMPIIFPPFQNNPQEKVAEKQVMPEVEKAAEKPAMPEEENKKDEVDSKL